MTGNVPLKDVFDAQVTFAGLVESTGHFEARRVQKRDVVEDIVQVELAHRQETSLAVVLCKRDELERHGEVKHIEVDYGDTAEAI